ncbi:MAG: hypothetical protein AAF721_03865 [Myxococcota bacterium]
MRRAWYSAALVCLALPGCGDECRAGGFDYRDGAVLERSEQLDAFEGECIVVLGKLSVVGERIGDLSGLEGILGIHGALVLRSTALTSTAGLSGLEYVNGNIVVADAPSLERVELPSLRSAGWDVRLARLPRLFDLDGFEALSTIEGSLSLRELDAMRTMRLPELSSVGGSVYIENNWHLEDLVEPDALFEIGGYLRVRGNPMLRSVSGFNALDRVGGTIRIGGNADRWYRYDWEPLEEKPQPHPGTVGGVRIDNNSKLESVSGFGSLRDLWAPPRDSSQNLAFFSIFTNHSLQTVNAFQGLSGARSTAPDTVWSYTIFVTVSNNPALQRLPRFAPLAGDDRPIFRSLYLKANGSLRTLDDLANWRFESVALLANDELHSLRGLRLTEASALSLIDNASLPDLDGLSMTEDAEPATRIRIEGNPSLLDISGLVRAHDGGVQYREIEVLRNGSLPQVQAAWVTGTSAPERSKVAGNAGWVASDPCPFVEDGECDEDDTFGRAICAPNTDEVDCAE